MAMVISPMVRVGTRPSMVSHFSLLKSKTPSIWLEVLLMLAI